MVFDTTLLSWSLPRNTQTRLRPLTRAFGRKEVDRSGRPSRVVLDDVCLNGDYQSSGRPNRDALHRWSANADAAIVTTQS